MQMTRKTIHHLLLGLSLLCVQASSFSVYDARQGRVLPSLTTCPWRNIQRQGWTQVGSSPSGDNEDASVEAPAKDDGADSESSNPLERLNSFLDTPILDANNRSNQGALSESLKDFVRDDPQMAQVTFSGIAVLFFLLVIRIANAVRYGGF